MIKTALISRNSRIRSQVTTPEPSNTRGVFTYWTTDNDTLLPRNEFRKHTYILPKKAISAASPEYIHITNYADLQQD